MIDILTENHSQGIRRTFGAICFNGFLKMMDAYTSDYPHYAHDVYRTWLIFGDPSLMVRTTAPSEITVTHPETIPLEIDIYPNPAIYQIVVNFNHHIFDNGMIYLYDIYGRLIMTNPVQNKIETISVDALPAGFYILQVMDGDRIIKNFKLIKN
jgi:hypothetical protein